LVQIFVRVFARIAAEVLRTYVLLPVLLREPRAVRLFSLRRMPMRRRARRALAAGPLRVKRATL
jgi:hypothetical protein